MLNFDCESIISNAIRARLTPREIEIARFFIASIASEIEESIMLALPLTVGNERVESPAILDCFSDVETALSQYQSGEYAQGRETYSTSRGESGEFEFVPVPHTSPRA